MKKIIILLMCFLLFAGCEAQNTTDNSLSVVSVSFPGYSFAKEILGEDANITLLLPLGSEAHGYEPTPKDIIKIQNCDLFIYGGGESEHWVEEIISTLDSEISTISMTSCVELLQAESPNQVSYSHEHTEEFDPHVWTSPKNAIKITEKISAVLCEKDKENAEIYKKNTENYLCRLQELDQAFSELNTKGKAIVMGDRFPFLYLAKEYGISYYAAFPGCAGETEPSAATVAALIERIKTSNIPAVFHTEFSNKKVCNTICEATNAKPLLLHSCHNVSLDDFKNGETYLTLMQKNLENLKEGLCYAD